MMLTIRKITHAITVCVIIAAPGVWSEAFAQSKTELVGSYSLVSAVATRADGSKYNPIGPTPKGRLMLDGDGRYSLLILSDGLPKFASNNRAKGTAEENRAIVQGSNCHFGTYEVNEAERTIVFHIEVGTFPNWNGTQQRRHFTRIGDELKYTLQGGSGGSQSTELIWKRMK